MTTEERSEIVSKIRLEIEVIEQQIPSLQEGALPVAPSVSLGRLTRMDAIGAQNMSEAQLSEAKSRLQKLRANLERSHSAQFGLCEGCGQPIAVPRLLYIPEATLCVNCA